VLPLVLACCAILAADAKVEKLKLGSGRDAHTYYLFVPEKAEADPAPLLLRGGPGTRGCGQSADRSAARSTGAEDPDCDLDWYEGSVLSARAVRRARDVLTEYGFTVAFTEIPNHTHDYYTTSAQTNREAWAFLQQQKLAKDPEFQPYSVR
jgi:hypothetical protein